MPIVEAGYSALSGERSDGHVDRLLSIASDLASSCGNPHGTAMVALVRGMAAFLAGRWVRASTNLEKAEALLRETCSGEAWELATSRLMGSASSYFLGEIKQLSERFPVLLQNARREAIFTNLQAARLNPLQSDGTKRRSKD